MEAWHYALRSNDTFLDSSKSESDSDSKISFRLAALVLMVKGVPPALIFLGLVSSADCSLECLGWSMFSCFDQCFGSEVTFDSVNQIFPIKCYARL